MHVSGSLHLKKPSTTKNINQVTWLFTPRPPSSLVPLSRQERRLSSSLQAELRGSAVSQRALGELQEMVSDLREEKEQLKRSNDALRKRSVTRVLAAHVHIHMYMYCTRARTHVRVLHTCTYTCTYTAHVHVHMYIYCTRARTHVHVLHTCTYTCTAHVHVHMYMYCTRARTHVHVLHKCMYTCTYICTCTCSPLSCSVQESDEGGSSRLRSVLERAAQLEAAVKQELAEKTRAIDRLSRERGN